MQHFLATLALLAFVSPYTRADNATTPEVSKLDVKFKSAGDETKIPERYRLQAHEFAAEMQLKADLTREGFQVFEVRFPSAVETRWKENNTVHAEYFRPVGKGPFAAVVVLDILAGDQVVSRMQAVSLAKDNIAALVVYMPFYGPRKPKEAKVRLLTPDVPQALEGIRQTVLDIRRAAAWLEAQKEIDGQRLGILGTSLGSFLGALTAEMEPKFKHVALLLGGGGLVDVFYDDPRAAPYRAVWQWMGGNKRMLAQLLAPADPITLAANLKDRKLIMINAKRDDVIPAAATEALWKAIGSKPKIIWYDATHVGAALFVIPAMQHISKHFKEE